MKLAISNIAWDVRKNVEIYKVMSEKGFSGIEIAPTKIFPQMPYDKAEEASEWSKRILEQYRLSIVSMQSIWFGRKENIFASSTERNCLLEYTKKAILFAEKIGCKNLVFGCPRNRNMVEDAQLKEAFSFFRELGEFAVRHNTVIGMEANPTIYNTNYITNTLSAIELIKEVDSQGFRLNLDFGTIIQNNESLEILNNNVHLINHVHISEPGLEKIKRRNEHQELSQILKNSAYEGYVSIEMKQQENTSDIISTMDYLWEVFA